MSRDGGVGVRVFRGRTLAEAGAGHTRMLKQVIFFLHDEIWEE